MGGEEFLSINSAIDASEAGLCAERLREAVEEHVFSHPGFDTKVTISLGVAERTPETATVDELIKRADEALYLAKAEGRNCVVVEGQVFEAGHESSRKSGRKRSA